MSPSPFLQIVHMGWVCECPEGGAAGRSTAFKFLALRGPHFYIFRHPPVITFINLPSTYKLLSSLFKLFIGFFGRDLTSAWLLKELRSLTFRRNLDLCG